MSLFYIVIIGVSLIAYILGEIFRRLSQARLRRIHDEWAETIQQLFENVTIKDAECYNSAVVETVFEFLETLQPAELNRVLSKLPDDHANELRAICKRRQSDE